jgi:hypothetical protein
MQGAGYLSKHLINQTQINHARWKQHPRYLTVGSLCIWLECQFSFIWLSGTVYSIYRSNWQRNINYSKHTVFRQRLNDSHRILHRECKSPHSIRLISPHQLTSSALALRTRYKREFLFCRQKTISFFPTAYLPIASNAALVLSRTGLRYRRRCLLPVLSSKLSPSFSILPPPSATATAVVLHLSSIHAKFCQHRRMPGGTSDFRMSNPC